MPFTNKPWDGSASRFPTPEAYCKSALIDDNPAGAQKTKAKCHLPIREPNGTYNINAIRNALARVGQVQTSPEKKARAKTRLQNLLAEAGGEPSRSSLADRPDMSAPQVVYRSAELAYSEGSEGKPGILEGKMVPYNVWTEIRSAVEGNFYERVTPGALKKTLSERANRMRVLFEHGFSRLLDKQPIAKLEELRDEEDGAYYRARLLPGLPDLLLEGLREGLYGSSIAMRKPIKADIDYTPKRSEMNPEGIPESTVLEAGVQEISVTAFPIYEGATAGVRSLTDDMILQSHGALIIAKLAREDPDRLLQLVRSELQVEPPHSEPPAEEETQEEREPEHSPKPTRDYLSDKESEEVWRLP